VALITEQLQIAIVVQPSFGQRHDVVALIFANSSAWFAGYADPAPRSGTTIILFLQENGNNVLRHFSLLAELSSPALMMRT
jgi:hypothetical protein